MTYEFNAEETQPFNTILDFLRYGVSQANEHELYCGHGTDNTWDDMVALVLGSLFLPSDFDVTYLQATLSPNEKNRLNQQLKRRIQDRVPVPYLTNRAYFCGLSFYVDERVLIPRSPIAELIEHRFSPWVAPDDVHRVLDLCTGSGCIAIACAYAFPEAHIDAVDISCAALDVARINQDKHGFEEEVTFIESDCFENVPPILYDLIISNPPYVGHEEMQTLPAEYLHEPSDALEASKNGLALVEKILNEAYNYLSEHGVLIVEVGNSAEAVETTWPTLPFTWLDFERGGEGVFLLTKQQLKNWIKV